MVIWTTTPWTLPANVAIAVASEGDLRRARIYERRARRRRSSSRESLVEKFCGATGWDPVGEPTQTLPRQRSSKASSAQHPFLPRTSSC